MAYAPDLDQMLHAGARNVDEQTHYVIERHLIGEVTLIIVTTGWGDGQYPTFTGYTAEGDISSFVTDFQVDPAGWRPFS